MLRVVGAVFGAFGLWLLLSLTPLGAEIGRAARGILPRWYVAINLVAVPVLAGLSAGPVRVSFRIRVVLCSLFLVSLVVAQIAAPVFRAGYAAMLAVLLAEAYWLVPKWNERNRRAH